MSAALNNDASSNFSWKDLKEKQSRKVLIYGTVLMALNQFCGCFPMMNFTATIFKGSGSTLSPNVSSIFVGVVQILGALLCTFMVEKAGRKLLFAVSAFGIALGLGVMSIYTFSTSRGYDLSNYSWIPLIAFSWVMCVYNWGVNTLPFLYISEIVQKKNKSFTMTFCLALLFIFATIVIQVRFSRPLLFKFLSNLRISCSFFQLSSKIWACTEQCCSLQYVH